MAFKIHFSRAWITAILLWCGSATAYAQVQEPRIINGSAAAEGAWPWMVSFFAAQGSPATAHFCGGTLIDPVTIATAAHCVDDFVETPDEIKAVVGRTTLTSSQGTMAQIAGIVVHPAFNPATFENDIALVRLARPVPQQPILLAGLYESGLWSHGEEGIVIGWGSMDPDYTIMPDKLQQAAIPFISDESCSDRLGLGFHSASMLCAGITASSPVAGDGVDACYGDSGGPLMAYTGSEWKLAGIASWGYSCATSRYWGVYTRAAAFLEWIASHPQIYPFVRSRPTVRGKPRVGAKLRCTQGEWGGESLSISYQWTKGARGRPIKNARRPWYRVKQSDSRKTLSCIVTAQNSSGVGQARSPRVGPVHE